MDQKYTEEQRQIITRVMRSLPQDVRQSLTPEQYEAFEMAIAVNNVRNDHYIDWRPVIGFGRWRYYAVFLLGKDRRKSPNRKGTLSRICKSLFILLCISTLLSLAFLVLYLIKSALGIDIFQHFSLGVWDYFKSHVLN